MTEDQLLMALGLRNILLDLRDHRDDVENNSSAYLDSYWPGYNRSLMLPIEMVERHKKEVLTFLEGEILAIQEQIEAI